MSWLAGSPKRTPSIWHRVGFSVTGGPTDVNLINVILLPGASMQLKKTTAPRTMARRSPFTKTDPAVRSNYLDQSFRSALHCRRSYQESTLSWFGCSVVERRIHFRQPKFASVRNDINNHGWETWKNILDSIDDPGRVGDDA